MSEVLKEHEFDDGNVLSLVKRGDKFFLLMNGEELEHPYSSRKWALDGFESAREVILKGKERGTIV